MDFSAVMAKSAKIPHVVQRVSSINTSYMFYSNLAVIVIDSTVIALNLGCSSIQFPDLYSVGRIRYTHMYISTYKIYFA